MLKDYLHKLRNLLYNKSSIDIFSVMKKFLKSRLFRRIIYVFAAIILFIILLDDFVLPWYVSSPETVVPKVIGMSETDAIKMLEDSSFDPIVIDTTFEETYPAGTIFLQKPRAGQVVKEGRNIYLYVSGGEQVVEVPKLIGKSVLDAKFSLERIGLVLGNVTRLKSEKPEDMIFDQQFAEGTELKRGQTVSITVSAGKGGGTISVPDLIGKSLTEALSILSDSSLVLGKINYQASQTLLPNTIIDQYPSSGNKLNPGQTVDLFVTKSSDRKTDEE